ncbi:MAG: dihydrolipoamide acetyltransferase family protein [Armatimonadota bacterium]|nr:dihydrolipoamide acetyltransferase family protein [Armatimonadota bacterium]MDR7444202.1 dihydrolipoamide acetyltransferase family protein [Armatimonadota bacterium]MDR7570588.1 dihydrolipoamide acetyltransferase family protein [Armatimonadota bacterium]MDR7614263.1 dihydrolipoamide acetyltransferase family protein [Armatimonadota bacterium]
MPVEVKLPQLGETVYEATVGKWLKRPGDRVERFEPLVELITEKVNVEMPAPLGGRLVEILVPEGQTVPTGTPIALMETEQPPPAEGRAVEERSLRLSPLVARLAREHGISREELERIPGTGAGGRITKHDLLRYLEQRGTPSPAETAPVQGEREDRLVPLDPLRRTIAERLSRSVREIPHAYALVEADVTDLVRYYERNREDFERRYGVRLTYTAFFLRAAVEALRAYPVVNAQWTEEGILLRGRIHIGVAVSTERGLLVPVIRDADEKSLVGIVRELDRLVRRAREGQLSLEEVQGGTFTLTNPGVFGSVWSMPIIHHPQAAILATDAITKRPVVRGEGIAIRSVMHLGLAFDHRVFDGEVAVRFLNRVKECLEAVDPVTR